MRSCTAQTMTHLDICSWIAGTGTDAVTAAMINPMGGSGTTRSLIHIHLPFSSFRCGRFSPCAFRCQQLALSKARETTQLCMRCENHVDSKRWKNPSTGLGIRTILQRYTCTLYI
eukprot:scpid109765/ scgid15220/ 